MATFPSDSVRTKNWITETLTDADLEGQLDLLHEYLKAALNSSTGHTHDGTSNQGPKLDKASIVSDFVNDYTTVTGASGDYLLLADVSDSNNTKKALASDFTYTPTAANALAGSVVQTKNVQLQTATTGTTTIPLDNSKPQNTEGDQYLSLAITPSNASNLLEIVVQLHVSHSVNTARMYAALFQDSTADCLASAASYIAEAANCFPLCFTFWMVAGTTSATTFKVRAGSNTAGTTTVSNISASAAFNSTLVSSMTIREIKA